MNYDNLYELAKVLCVEEIKEYQYSLELPPECEESRFDLDNLLDYELEEIFYDKYLIDLDQAHDLIKDLLPLIDVAKSELTNKVYKGFGKDNLWLIKEEVN